MDEGISIDAIGVLILFADKMFEKMEDKTEESVSRAMLAHVARHGFKKAMEMEDSVRAMSDLIEAEKGAKDDQGRTK